MSCIVEDETIGSQTFLDCDPLQKKQSASGRILLLAGPPKFVSQNVQLSNTSQKTNIREKFNLSYSIDQLWF